MQEGKYLVIGAARSGLAASEFLAQKGKKVILADTNANSESNAREFLKNYNVEYIFSEQPIVDNSIEMLVMSPGVPLSIAPVVKAKELGIRVIGEVELAFGEAKAPIVAITGTNGKTTTTTLVGEIFKNWGSETYVGGNIGIPLLDCAKKCSKDGVIVAELSSFQLESTVAFKPKAGAILNLTPDHLDRHKNMQGYLEAKAKIFAFQDENDFLVLNYDDEYLRDLKGIKSKVLFFSSKHILNEGVFVDNGIIKAIIDKKVTEICKACDVSIKGEHNLQNALASVALCLVMGVKAEVIANTLRNFKAVEHRMEPVRTFNGVLYVNDSKGTNPDSTTKAIESYDNIVLILGGKNKGLSFVPLAKLVKEKVKQVVLVGMASDDFVAAFNEVGYNNYVCANSFADAVKRAKDLASVGDVVLLSPACTSWDMFKSFEERGDLFKNIVNSF